MATVPGIDVSYWNAGIDWPKVRAAGQRFVFAKATEGDFYADPTFDDNCAAPKRLDSCVEHITSFAATLMESGRRTGLLIT